MKKYFCILLLISAVHFSFSQQNQYIFNGNWLGKIQVHGQELRIGLCIQQTSDSIHAYLMSPDQAIMYIAVSSVKLTHDSIYIKSKEISASFAGIITTNRDSIKGQWIQGLKLPLHLGKVSALPELKRTQQPQKPYPYTEEEIQFRNEKAGITLSGTLTIPEGKQPCSAVVLVSGSGPQNRDEELLGHKPFLILADYLTRHGIAVLRYDDRGVGKSQGVFSTATTFDFADDAEAAFAYLANNNIIHPAQIGIVGHSEGGIIAPIVAARNKNVSFIVLLAGTGIKGKEIILQQSELIARAENTPENEIEKTMQLTQKLISTACTEQDDKKAAEKMRNEIDKFWSKLDATEQASLGSSKSALIQSVYQFLTPWMRTFLNLNPGDYLRKVSCPLLAINGDKDLQVPADVNLNAIQQALTKAKNANITVRKFEGLNHLFQHANSGSPSEYIEIEETIAPEVLEYVLQWLKRR